MRAFGALFTLLGLGLIAVSARAISDPESPIGWRRWTDDPWSQGLVIGASLVVVGIILLAAKTRLGPTAERAATRVLSSVVAGVLGFLLLAPFGVTSMCADGPNGGGCRNQSWSTVTGLTFEGNPNPALGLAASVVLAATAWFLVGSFQNRSH